MNNPLTTYRKLRALGVLGMNARNCRYIQPLNPRANFPNADSKVIAKKLAIDAGIPVPELYRVIASVGELKNPEAEFSKLAEHFVLKPEHGSGGQGVLVLSRKQGGGFISASGRELDASQVHFHIANTLHGLYSLGGRTDRCMVEYRVEFDPVFEKVSYRGVPDIRIICYRGVPVMAMARFPTKQSGGRANLHQGAIGVGVDLATGTTQRGVQGSKTIAEHPDTQEPITGLSIPRWHDILDMACRCNEVFKLGYMGIDIVLDSTRGPLLLEVNVRPGLAIQLANQAGLSKRCERVEQNYQSLNSTEKRMNFVASEFAAPTPTT